MSTKLLDRLLFAQGGFCFFSNKHYQKSDPALSSGRGLPRVAVTMTKNRVACCKTLNARWEASPLKEKFQVMLNQKGSFNCPTAVMEQNTAKSVGANPNLVGTCRTDLQKCGKLETARYIKAADRQDVEVNDCSVCQGHLRSGTQRASR